MSAQRQSSVTASAPGFNDSTFHDSTYQPTRPDHTPTISIIAKNLLNNASNTQPRNISMASQAAPPPLFAATSTSVRHLSALLSTIRFSNQCQVSILPDGINFAVEEARAMQGTVFLDRALFTSYTYHPISSVSPDSSLDQPRFNISLPALVETLNIFGASESSKALQPERDEYASNIRPGRINAFSTSTLGITGLCKFSYGGEGEPLKIILEEAGVTTTCELVTYEAEGIEEIPFDKAQLEAKIILQSRYLYDAIQEISHMTSMSSGPSSRLKIVASPQLPYFSLSSAGALGSAAVEFSKSRELLETFQVRNRLVQYYKFELVKQASEAMKLASKVSLRGDRQGVLSLQFMVENEGGGQGWNTGISFVDFRFVPCVEEGEDEDEETEDDLDYVDAGEKAEESLLGDEL